MADKQYNNQEEIPVEFHSLEEAGEFWDTHSTADYEGLLEPVDVEIDLPKQQDKSKVTANALEG